MSLLLFFCSSDFFPYELIVFRRPRPLLPGVPGGDKGAAYYSSSYESKRRLLLAGLGDWGLYGSKPPRMEPALRRSCLIRCKFLGSLDVMIISVSALKKSRYITAAS